MKKLFQNEYKDHFIKKNQTFKVSVNFVDTLNQSYNYKFLKLWFKKKTNFVFEINTENPDFLFYNVWGNEHLNPKYNTSVKIAAFSENGIPNLNNADYALSQAHIMYLDRYFKFPFFITSLNKLKNNNEIKLNRNTIKKKFCAAVISNTRSYSYFRLNFIKELNKYKKIDLGGRFLNNIGGYVKNKIKFLSEYKFSIAMENSNGDGYISEKIIDSFIAGNIPIYYGDYMVDEFINNKAYILIKGKQDIKEKIEYIKKIDNDDYLYQSILKEKLFNQNIVNIIKDNEIERFKFLRNIFIQQKIKAKRIDNYF